LNSKQKGKRGELEPASCLRDHGFRDIRRSVQYNGKAEDANADLVGMPGYLETNNQNDKTSRVRTFFSEILRSANVKMNSIQSNRKQMYHNRENEEHRILHEFKEESGRFHRLDNQPHGFNELTYEN